MRSLLLALLIGSAVFSCKNEPATTLIFSGKIENPKDDKISISGDDFRITIPVKEDGTFADTMEIPEGFYRLRHHEWTNAYLKPGFNLRLTLDTEKFDSTVTYTGIGSMENNYMASKVLAEPEVFGSRSEFFSLDESEFLKSLEEKITILKKNLDSAMVPDAFKTLELKSIEYKRLLSMSQYPSYHAYYTKNDTFKVSENFGKELLTIDYDNQSDFALYDNYRSLVESHYTDYDVIDSNQDTIVSVISNLRALKSQNIKNSLVKNLSVFFLSPSNPQVAALYDGIMELSNDSTFKKEVTNKYNQVKTLTPGNPAPVFTYKDKDGNTVSLADLKGKYVYIDVWATWCGPCIREIPSLKKMEEAYRDKNIQFVSVSIDPQQDYDKWQQMIVDKELTGLQLFAEGDWGSQICKDYIIQSIPRFLLIDPQGNIVSADAYRPSDERLKSQFDGFGATL